MLYNAVLCCVVLSDTVLYAGEVYSLEEEDTEDLLWTKEMEMDFFSRMEESEAKREVKLKEMDEELYGDCGRVRGSSSSSGRVRGSGGDSEWGQFYT